MSLRQRAAAVGAATALAAGLLGAMPHHAAAAPSTLMISAYLEGSSNNKALELYNPTARAIDLTGHRIEMFLNGASSAGLTVTLSGTVAPGGYHHVVHASADAQLLALAEATNGSGWYNGDDAVVLRSGTTVVDSLGQVGHDPGTEWGSELLGTGDGTLVRSACVVDADPTDAFDPTAQWTGKGLNAFSALGTFTCDGSTQPTDPPEPEEPAIVPIGTVQGTGDRAAYVGRDVTVEGVVTGDFQTGGFDGFFVQDAGDGDTATSDAVFVYRGGVAVSPGDRVRVAGRVSEYRNQTQLSPTSVEVLGSGGPVTPLDLTLPLVSPERHEGMLVRFSDELTIIEYFNFDRYGEIVYGTSRQHTPTAVVEPGPAAQSLLSVNLANRLVVDDGRTDQNPSPAIHPNGEAFTRDNYFRGGDGVSGITGVLSYVFNAWKVQPTQGATHVPANPRPDVPEVGGDLTVASMNVLNYFTTLRSDDPEARGADTVEEFERQQAKIVAALAAMDADVVGLMEIENNGTAVENLVTALNAHLGADTYRAVNTGVVGSDAIIQALIYKRATVQPVGDWAALDYGDDLNRPTLLQTFKQVRGPEKVNVAVNHLKSKGSSCAGVGDPDTGDGSGNCNGTRLAAAERMIEWLASDPTGVGEARTLVIGDLNSYDHEAPIDAFVEAGYTDLEKQFGGEGAYSYVFDGMIGYLDYALANESLAGFVTGSAAWHINADESDLFDYDTTYKGAAEADLWAADPYRSSDHDPVLVGLTLTEPNSGRFGGRPDWGGPQR